MKDFINDRWRPILAFNGLDDFDALWKLDAEWFEAPNERRGGWSGVARCELPLPDGGTAAIFLKRQENHQTRSLAHPLRGVPTFLREFRRIMAYRGKAVPTLEPVYFGMRGGGEKGGNRRAILATEELTGFVSLHDYERAWPREGIPPRRERQDILRAVAELLRKMHAHGIRHGCFYPKHVFVRVHPGGPAEARVIDLEKSRWRPRFLCAPRDLYSLNHYASPAWSRADRIGFLKRYLDIPRLDDRAKRLCRAVAALSARKDAAREES
ncbi:MAG: lipopolysaccharide kinase InaA family protein [Candidatus Accumulibacter sp.]|nr:lipopolysaccharide kinase InaA family protein [Accumulibacter sp.]